MNYWKIAKLSVFTILLTGKVSVFAASPVRPTFEERNAVIREAAQLSTGAATLNDKILYFSSFVSQAQKNIAYTSPSRTETPFRDSSSSRPHLLEDRSDFAVEETEIQIPDPDRTPRGMIGLKNLLDHDPQFARTAGQLIDKAFSRPAMIGGEADPTTAPDPSAIVGSQSLAGKYVECVGVGNSTDPSGFIGTGVLVSSNFLLTARHVRALNPSYIYLGPKYGDPSGRFIPLATQKTNYFQYADHSYADLALICLAQSANLDEYPVIASPADDIAALQSLVLVGYGSVDPTSISSLDPYRRFVTVPLSTNFCACHGPFDRSKTFCGVKLVNGRPAWGPAMVSECKGDSGGPCYRSEDDRVLCAIITDSFGLDANSAPDNQGTVCGNGGLYQRIDVFSKSLTSYLNRNQYQQKTILSDNAGP